MKSKLLVILIALTVSTPIYAGSRWIGSPDCGEWVAQSKTTLGSVHRAWLLGYLSGLNLGFRHKEILGNVSAPQIYLWMDNYCKAHPLNKVIDGGLDLSVELADKS